MKTAVITGITHGIGRAITEKFLHEGFHVIGCARNAEDLKAMEAQWNGKLQTQVVDVAERTQIEDFAKAILSTGNTPDILVNNAGIYQPGNLADEPEGQLEKMLSVNLLSAYHLTRALLPQMKTNDGGHIFNLCSIASLQAYPGGGAYSVSKYALLGFSDNLREELKSTGIRVTAICPGAVWSRSWEGSGVNPETIVAATDIAEVVWSANNLSPAACLERIVVRPQGGDL